jgi:hypothetical protein
MKRYGLQGHERHSKLKPTWKSNWMAHTLGKHGTN